MSYTCLLLVFGHITMVPIAAQAGFSLSRTGGYATLMASELRARRGWLLRLRQRAPVLTLSGNGG